VKEDSELPPTRKQFQRLKKQLTIVNGWAGHNLTVTNKCHWQEEDIERPYRQENVEVLTLLQFDS
jgi:hypothetical protein